MSIEFDRLEEVRRTVAATYAVSPHGALPLAEVLRTLALREGRGPKSFPFYRTVLRMDGYLVEGGTAVVGLSPRSSLPSTAKEPAMTATATKIDLDTLRKAYQGDAVFRGFVDLLATNLRSPSRISVQTYMRVKVGDRRLTSTDVIRIYRALQSEGLGRYSPLDDTFLWAYQSTPFALLVQGHPDGRLVESALAQKGRRAALPARKKSTGPALPLKAAPVQEVLDLSRRLTTVVERLEALAVRYEQVLGRTP